MSDYFIDYDAHNDPWVWRENGERPIQVLNLLHIAPEHAPLLDLIRAAVEGEVREEWGVRGPSGGLLGDTCTREQALLLGHHVHPATPVRRTVITGAWEEER